MTTIERKHFRSLEVLIQSKLAELTGSDQGLVVVVPSRRTIDVYSTVGSGLDVQDEEALRRLPWITVRPDTSGWTFESLSDESKRKFLPD